MTQQDPQPTPVYLTKLELEVIEGGLFELRERIRQSGYPDTDNAWTRAVYGASDKIEAAAQGGTADQSREKGGPV